MTSTEEDPSGDAAFVQLRGISKRFGGTQALDDVTISLVLGEVHAFVGENGAGKSTLGKIVAGLYTHDSGHLLVGGEEVGRWDPLRAQRGGIAMIAQELSLVPELTVEQNVFLGIEHNTLGVMKGDLSARYAELESQAHFGLPPRVKVGTLRIADQQKVEILRALARDAKVIVMDEPTSSLTAHETARLHELILGLKAQGRAVVYVSHFLDAVLEVCDTVSIMRDGRLQRSGPVAAETKKTIVEAMLGKELAFSFPERAPAPDVAATPVLVLDALASDGGVVDASLVVRPGEIVGLLGLVGSGRTEILKAVFGVDRVTGGSLTFRGENIVTSSPRRSIARGMGFVPEDRHKEGLVLARSVRENVSLAFLRHFSTFGVVDGRKERREVTRSVTGLQMRPPAIGLPISGFSGGNQQKALLSKWLIGNPQLVILDEPTRGVDIGAKFTIYEAIIELARQGVAVLLVSSEHEEVLNLSHRAYLVSEFETRGEIDPATTTLDALLYKLFSVLEPKENA
ncbi:sugar ABC transporter ATP-binding protein [Subtercola sp. Z020]|uniref:sugar ABC transporter ATP-binding protein n=1 Tax=Subtercola sp. Z020 TaxID=2080582 RepID=UPI00130E882B|nr:sugar ABC transporter ATP-binding protein [Subtercola sp. Z020]